MRHWCFWEWVAYACLFLAAAIEAAEAGIKQSPILASKMPNVFASEFLGFVPFTLVLLGTVVLLVKNLMPQHLGPDGSPKFQSVLQANSLRDACKISSGQDEAYDRLDIYPNGAARRTISLKVENVGNGLLSNCSVWLKAVSPPLEGRPLNVFSGATPLVPGQYKFFPVATFMEVNLDLAGTGDFVTLCEPYGGGFMHSPTLIKPPKKDKPLLLTIEARAHECRSSEAHFKLWVDQSSRRLHVEAA